MTSHATRRVLVIAALVGMALPLASTASNGAASVNGPAARTVRASTPTDPGAYVALPPARIVDTATGLGGWQSPPPGTSIFPTITGFGGVPATGVSAVLLSLTAATPEAPGYLDVYPAGQPGGDAINFYFPARQTTANLVLTPVGTDGRIVIKNGSAFGTTRIVADVQGYVVAGTPVAPGAIESLAAVQIYKTFSRVLRLKSHATLVLDVDRGTTPTLGAAFLNVTAGGPDVAGYLTVYPTGTTRPTTSNVNFNAGSTTSNLVLARLGSGGAVSIYNGSGGSTSLYVDLQGQVLSGTGVLPGTVRPLAPARIVDTAIGLGAPRRPLPGQTPIDITVLGHGGVPTAGVAAVVLNVTVATPQRSGYLSVYPAGQTRPNTSNLNFSAGRNVAGLVVVPVGADGKVTVYAGSSGTTRLVVDVAGFIPGD